MDSQISILLVHNIRPPIQGSMIWTIGPICITYWYRQSAMSMVLSVFCSFEVGNNPNCSVISRQNRTVLTGEKFNNMFYNRKVPYLERFGYRTEFFLDLYFICVLYWNNLTSKFSSFVKTVQKPFALDPRLRLPKLQWPTLFTSHF